MLPKQTTKQSGTSLTKDRFPTAKPKARKWKTTPTPFVKPLPVNLRGHTDCLEELCLSFDVGTKNTGVCLYDPNENKILYWDAHELMDTRLHATDRSRHAHESLKFIMNRVGKCIGGKTFWVVVEYQKATIEAFKRRMTINWSLQYIIAEYFHATYGGSILVDFVDPELRKRFRETRILEHDYGTAFSKDEVHDAAKAWLKHNPDKVSPDALDNWSKAKWPKPKQDMADAFVQMWVYYFKDLDSALKGETFTFAEAERRKRAEIHAERERLWEASYKAEARMLQMQRRREERDEAARTLADKAKALDPNGDLPHVPFIHRLYGVTKGLQKVRTGSPAEKAILLAKKATLKDLRESKETGLTEAERKELGELKNKIDKVLSRAQAAVATNTKYSNFVVTAD
jgi:hypothetical protein